MLVCRLEQRIGNARNTNIVPAPNHTPMVADIRLNMPTLLLDLAMLGRQEGVFDSILEVASNIMYLDLGRWITGSAWCLSGPLKRPGSTFLCCSVSLATSQEKHEGDSEPPDINFCMRLLLVSFTLIYSCTCIIIETLHDQPFSHI